MRRQFILFSLFLITLEIIVGYFYPKFLWSLIIVVPIVLWGTYEMLQKKRTLLRNFPILARLRYIMEDLRPKIYQYFIESDTDGTPINRILRSVVYQRAKKELSTTPFGTQLNIYEPGYEWINHSMNPLDLHSVKAENLTVKVGGQKCKKPYNLSVFNISAMSYGALSRNAVEALNWGAQMGGFAHNTGEGGISPYHLKHGGDIIWQIGTGYFGCRNSSGHFDAEKFKEKAIHPSVKMVEIKLSQGAKPGHGGILPAEKNTPEIAEIRGVPPYTTIESPSKHSAFSGPHQMMEFVQKLRELSEGKPIGIKLCLGSPEEFEYLCKAMIETGITPDFISVDGSEGGTGAAPLEFSNFIGMSLTDGLIIVRDFLDKYDLKKDIRILCAGKVISGFHIVRAISLGADACYSARGMMLALGCIQALECNKNTCPTGVATQNPQLYKGLYIPDKAQRIANYHRHTLESVTEILAAAGIDNTAKLNRSHIWRRITPTKIKTYAELYPPKRMMSKAS